MTDSVHDTLAGDAANSDDIPSAADFSAQLIRQVLADLDGVLLDSGGVADDALAMLGAAAAAGRTRGGALTLLARAALSAHHALVYGRDADFADVPDADVGAVLLSLSGAQTAQLPVLHKAASAIEHYVAAAEPGAPPPAQTLALAIYRLYEGLRSEDEALGGRGLVELRALTVHLDATAAMLDLGRVSAEPLRVIRPDRFHDYFFRFTSLAQTQNAGGEERAVAALSRDGRIEALVTEDAVHPIVAAAIQVRDAVNGDDITKDHALARIRAVLVFLAALRNAPNALVGDAVADTEAHLALVIAAATAPLRLGADFEFTALAQVARYNRVLLRGARQHDARTH